MFGHTLNQMRIDLSITPRAPLLIRSGRTGADPTRPDLACVRTRVDGQPSVYIPGASLKGVMRSHAERLLLSDGVAITDTFSAEGQQAFNQGAPGDEVYAGTCPLGRTFGNLHLKGHTSVSDHTPGGHEPPGSAERQRHLDDANDVEQRNGVGIDRLMGSAKGGALFDQEVVVAGRFDGRILLRNVQLYQLALVLLVLRDLDDGYVQIGSGTTRGNGWVGAEIRAITMEGRVGSPPSPPLAAEGTLLGAGRLAAEPGRYALFDGDEVVLRAGVERRTRLVWDQVVVPGNAVDAFAEDLVGGPWAAFLDQAKELTWAA